MLSKLGQDHLRGVPGGSTRLCPLRPANERPRLRERSALHQKILDHLGLSPSQQDKPSPAREIVRVAETGEGWGGLPSPVRASPSRMVSHVAPLRQVRARAAGTPGTLTPSGHTGPHPGLTRARPAHKTTYGSAPPEVGAVRLRNSD